MPDTLLSPSPKGENTSDYEDHRSKNAILLPTEGHQAYVKKITSLPSVVVGHIFREDYRDLHQAGHLTTLFPDSLIDHLAKPVF